MKSNIILPGGARGTVYHSRVNGPAMYELDELYSPDTAFWQSKCLDLIWPSFTPTNGYWWDRSRYQNHGTINGAIWRDLDSGIRVLEFDGVDDYVEVPDSASLKSATGAGQARTLELWFKTTQAGNKIVFEKGTNKHFEVQLGYPTDGKIHWRVESGTANIFESLSAVNNDVWHYFAGTYDGTVAEFFIDAVSQGTNSSQVAPADDTDNISIGSRLGTAAFTGKLGGVFISNRVLTSGEINVRYNRERHLYGV